jgi:hypothetical protein
MVEKKYSRISVRVPQSWKRTCHEKGIEISLVCRAALFQAINQTDPVLRAGAKLKSKQQAASIFNALRPFFVRTIPSDFDEKMKLQVFKTPLFKATFLPLAEPEEVIVLGEFLNQGEYAEEILQEVYSHDVR